MDASEEYIRTIRVCQRQTTTTGRRALHFHQYEIHTLFDELIHRPWGRAHWNPPVDIRENDTAFLIEIDLPGVKPEDVHIIAEGPILTIQGQRELMPCDENRATYLCERPAGGFARKFEFRDEIRNRSIKSHWENGVLTVTVAKPQSEMG